MIHLKEITDKSWLVLADDTEQSRVGLLSSNPTGYTLLSTGGKVSFATEEEVTAFFEEDVFKNIIQPALAEAREYFIKGYPVDFDSPFEVEGAEVSSDLPLFTKTKASKVYHCAGYYCILFPKGWTHSFCPKKATLDKYEYTGPFKTEMEMKSHLSVLKQNDKRD